ncbi:hypothetical protein [Actinomadura sp. 9N407]|uniref:hypothetical protein n=1 Tax=Actinomadura sp. 9N407 TaxID=3375154 RepID=UPI0037B83AD3
MKQTTHTGDRRTDVVDDDPRFDVPRVEDVVGHWRFVFEMDERGFASGELVLLRDGTLLRRYGTSYYSKGLTTWKFNAWRQVSWWPGASSPEEAIPILLRNGYELYEPSPVPVDERTAGPFPGVPREAVPIHPPV